MIDYNDQPLHRIAPSYLEKYGLLEPPFTAVADDRFYFNSADAHQRLNLMVHMTQYSDMVIMVLGDEGIGKTTLLQQYVKASHDNWHICRINANTMMDRDQLLFRIAEDFGLESLPADSAELQELLYDKLTTLHQNDVLPVIIVDDAHELPIDAISQLFIMAEIKAGDTTMMHIVLFGEPSIEKTINASVARKIRERIGHSFELSPFDEGDTADYIQTRMSIAGLQTENPFSPKVVRQIHKQSQGNPARINELAHIALDESSNEGEPYEDELEEDHLELTQTHILTPMRVFSVLSVTIIAGLGLWQQDNINQFFESGKLPMQQQTQLESDVTELDDNQPSPFAKLKQQMFKLGGIKSDSDKPEQRLLKTATPAAPVNLERIEDPAIAQQLQTAASPPPMPVIESISPDKLVASSQKQTITLRGKNFAPDSRVTLVWSGNKKTLPISRLDEATENTIRFSLNTGKQSDEWQVYLSHPSTGQSNSVVFKVTNDKPEQLTQAKQINKTETLANSPAQNAGQDWIQQQPVTNLTLQLLGSHSLTPINKYIDQYGMEEKTILYKTRRDNKDWYVLFYGSFKDSTEAMQALKTLPGAARKNKPWMRSFASIQAQERQLNNKAALSKTMRGKNIPTLANIEAHEAWLWSQDPGKYTLQLLGTQNINKLQSFIKQHKLRGKVVYYHTRRDNQDWYALVYGVYPKNDDARSAVSELPPQLKKLSPWVRNFSAIHAEMGKTSQ